MTTINKFLRRFASVKIDYDLESLSTKNQECLRLLVEASKVIDKIWAKQMWSQSEAFFSYVETLDKDSDVYKYIKINKGPWSELDEGKRFVNFNEATPDTPPEGKIELIKTLLYLIKIFLNFSM